MHTLSHSCAGIKAHMLLCIVLILSCFTTAVSAQEPTWNPTKTNYKKVEDVVYLNSGSIIRGRLQYYDPAEKVRILCSDGNEYVFKAAEIKEVKQEPLPGKRLNPPATVGSYASLAFPLAFGVNEFDQPTLNPGIYASVGQILNQRIGVGGSVGIQNYREETLVPIEAELRYYMKKGALSQPFLRAHGGFAGGWVNPQNGNEHLGGPLGGIDIGIANKATRYRTLSLSLGVNYQRSRTRGNDWIWGENIITVNQYFRYVTRISFDF